jgi:hypothetical protein
VAAHAVGVIQTSANPDSNRQSNLFAFSIPLTSFVVLPSTSDVPDRKWRGEELTAPVFGAGPTRKSGPQTGSEEIYTGYFWYINLFREAANDFVAAVLSLNGKARKLLVVDLDNTCGAESLARPDGKV